MNAKTIIKFGDGIATVGDLVSKLQQLNPSACLLFEIKEDEYVYYCNKCSTFWKTSFCQECLSDIPFASLDLGEIQTEPPDVDDPDSTGWVTLQLINPDCDSNSEEKD